MTSAQLRMDGKVETKSDTCFVAIDFETADQWPDSACSVGLVKARNFEVVDKLDLLIRPPRPLVRFTFIHGITWPMVADKPSFGDLWPRISEFLGDAQFMAAHNASFDRGVLRRCCEMAGVAPPNIPFFCTVQLSRKTWNLRRANLPFVCQHLGLTLNHHQAVSDAEACAKIVIEAKKFRGKLALPWNPLRSI